MTKLAWLLALVPVVALPASGLAQYSGGQRASATRSVLRPADQVHWSSFHGNTVAGHFGCATHTTGCAKPICYGYDNCCPPRPLLCCLKHIARTLDCLLPCGCSRPCKFWGDCRPHFFLGGRCCEGGGSCGGPIGCSTPIGQPMFTDPFIDDPLPPMPTPTPATDVRHYTPRSSPYKVSTAREVARQRAIEAAARRSPPTQVQLQPPRDRVAQHTGRAAVASEQSVLRRTTLAQPSYTKSRGAAAQSAEPALLPVTIRRTSAEETAHGQEIPVNPLRR